MHRCAEHTSEACQSAKWMMHAHPVSKSQDVVKCFGYSELWILACVMRKSLLFRVNMFATSFTLEVHAFVPDRADGNSPRPKLQHRHHWQVSASIENVLLTPFVIMLWSFHSKH